MHDRTRAMMVSVYNKLTKDQLDDLESKFENFDVICNQVLDWLLEGEGSCTHAPALELHVGELAHDILLHVTESAQRGENPHTVMFDQIKMVLYFGIEIGRLGWPIERRPCREVHR